MEKQDQYEAATEARENLEKSWEKHTVELNENVIVFRSRRRPLH
jgi:hypothetical protein